MNSKICNVIILDDCPARHKSADLLWPGCRIVHCYTYFHFLSEILKGTHFDIVALDHDLGDFRDADVGIPPTVHSFQSDPRPLNGCDAALWLTLNRSRAQFGDIIVHSANPHGAKRMMDTFAQAGWAGIIRKFIDVQ